MTRLSVSVRILAWSTLVVSLVHAPTLWSQSSSRAQTRIPFEVVARHPHDREAFTQGLYYEDGFLFESTGRNGSSSLRKVDLTSGLSNRRLQLSDRFFGEGIAAVGNHIYQLTWLSGLAIVYDRTTFEEVRRIPYLGEGWGLTHDGRFLVMSDGSATLRFVEPVSFNQVRTLLVHDDSGPVAQLNELEYIRGQIFANIWHTNRIVRISPRSGEVTGEMDLTSIAAEVVVSDPEAVLNGIAYDSVSDRLFVTGKLWPTLFELRLLEENP